MQRQKHKRLYLGKTRFKNLLREEILKKTPS